MRITLMRDTCWVVLAYRSRFARRVQTAFVVHAPTAYQARRRVKQSTGMFVEAVLEAELDLMVSEAEPRQLQVLDCYGPQGPMGKTSGYARTNPS